jgi:hypothetical protein
MTTKWTLITCGAILLVWGIGLAAPARLWAQDAADPNAGLVAVGGEEVLRLRVAPPSMTLSQRAGAIQERLVTILSDTSLRPGDVTVRPVGTGKMSDAVIRVKSRLLVTVTRRDAEANSTTPRLLAEGWARHVRKVLPQVNVRPNPNNGAPPSR